MHRKGLIDFYYKRHKKYWVAENPEKLMRHIKESQDR